MGLIDILVILIISLSALIAFSRGLVRELLGLTAWILAIVGAIYGVEYIQPLFLKHISNKTLANIAGIATISLTVLVVCTIVNAKIAKKLRKSALNGLDRILGAGFGVLRGLFLIIIVYLCCVILIAKEDMLRYKETNWTMPLIEKASEPIEKAIPKDLFKPETSSKEKTDEKKEEAKTSEKDGVKGISKETKKKEIKIEEKTYNAQERNDMDALILEQIQ